MRGSYNLIKVIFYPKLSLSITGEKLSTPTKDIILKLDPKFICKAKEPKLPELPVPAAVIPAKVGTFNPCLFPKVPAPFDIPEGTVKGNGVVC